MCGAYQQRDNLTRKKTGENVVNFEKDFLERDDFGGAVTSNKYKERESLLSTLVFGTSL